jgi:hypothetical protein
MENSFLYDIAIVLALIFLFIIMVRFVRSNYPLFVKLFSAETDEVRFLKGRIKELEAEVKTLKATVEILVERLRHEEVPTAAQANKLPPRPVLLVFGNVNFGEQDRQALRRAGIPFFRLSHGKLDELRNEIQRRRSDGTLYDIVHFAAKGTEDGFIDLNGQFVDGAQLADVLSGVRGVFLSTCSNHYVVTTLQTLCTNFTNAMLLQRTLKMRFGERLKFSLIFLNLLT